MKSFKIILSCLLIFGVFVSGCVAADDFTKKPATQITTPTKVIESSLERELINRWLAEVGDPNNIMWLYHMSETGQILGEYPIVGKAVSMTKSNEPYERVSYSDAYFRDELQEAYWMNGFRWGTTQLANPSGTYGHDLEGVFFFTPDGEYHEIHGGIIHVSSVPLKIDPAVFLTYDIDKEKQEKEKQWEDKLRNNT